MLKGHRKPVRYDEIGFPRWDGELASDGSARVVGCLTDRFEIILW